MLYRGYVQTRNKKSIEGFKGRRELKTLDDVKDLPEYGGVLAKDVVLIDIDDKMQSDILMQIVEDMQLDCKVLQTRRGRHFLFRNADETVKQCFTRCSLAIGLKADIKVGLKDTYEVIKFEGRERFCEWDIETGDYQEMPRWLQPLKFVPDFRALVEGDGRNQELFNYILNLQANGFDVETSRETIRIINKYVMRSPLPDDELETVLRDDAFKKPVFYKGQTFLFNKFATYMISACHAVRINDQLHVYQDGAYRGGKEVEKAIISYIPNLKKTQRHETIDYMELIAPDVTTAGAEYIGFRNGVLNINNGQIIEASPDIVLTNRIEWDYNPAAYDELGDKVLNRLACNDPEIRALLEECIGYCMYRRNELGKAFILTGDKSNGKSTFLDVVKVILGEANISVLDLSEMGDRFSTSMMCGKLANIGDDIGDDFLQGSQVAMFKKVVTGNRIKAERKGRDPFEFNPYVKLLFSANDIPRMRDKTGAVLRRLIIIPFNATFSKYLPDGSPDPDYDPYIKDKLVQANCIEYLIRLGVDGLKRVLANCDFTKSVKIQSQIESYELENNPIKAFLEETDIDAILHESTDDVYRLYSVFCAGNNMNPMGRIAFSKQLCKRLGLKSMSGRVGGKVVRIFERAE